VLFSSSRSSVLYEDQCTVRTVMVDMQVESLINVTGRRRVHGFNGNRLAATGFEAALRGIVESVAPCGGGSPWPTITCRRVRRPKRWWQPVGPTI
jgi:hypothetical protein